MCEYCDQRKATTSWDCVPACARCARDMMTEMVEYDGIFSAANELASHFDGDITEIFW